MDNPDPAQFTVSFRRIGIGLTWPQLLVPARVSRSPSESSRIDLLRNGRVWPVPAYQSGAAKQPLVVLSYAFHHSLSANAGGLRRSATASRSCIHRSPSHATIIATSATGRRDFLNEELPNGD